MGRSDREARRADRRREALAALGFLIALPLLMGDSPGCPSCADVTNPCGGAPLLDETFAITGDCSAPGTLRFTGARDVCEYQVSGHAAWKRGVRSPNTNAIWGAGAALWLTADDGREEPCTLRDAAPGEYQVTCDRRDGGACTSTLAVVTAPAADRTDKTLPP
jgi:hypothetical protein